MQVPFGPTFVVAIDRLVPQPTPPGTNLRNSNTLWRTFNSERNFPYCSVRERMDILQGKYSVANANRLVSWVWDRVRISRLDGSEKRRCRGIVQRGKSCPDRWAAKGCSASSGKAITVVASMLLR